jgi:Na+/melibiose symporter-like transporter
MEPQADFSGFHFFAVILWLLVVAVMMIPYVKIIKKAGYSGWWILSMFVPLLNVVMLWVFAFSTWPVEQRARSEDAF